MAYTTADRDAVKAAILQMGITGREVSVRFADGSGVTYAPVDMAQLTQLLNLIDRDIAAALAVTVGARPPIRAIRLMPGSGY